MSTIRIVYAVVDTERLTLWKEDGSTVLIPQGDPRIATILEQVLPIIKQGLVATVDLEAADSPYEAFERKTGGLVRFFRVARRKLNELFGSQHETAPEGEYGIKPTREITEVISEVMSHAKPVSEPSPQEAESVVAFVGDRIIPDADKLKTQLTHAVGLDSTKGMQVLLTRLAGIIDQRMHSVEDVLTFLSKADLPIADDGSIIAYKILNKRGDSFRDCHTGNVPQNVGSYVVVDESLVDLNRRNECSNGLHIARRSYLKHFSGTDCFLVKVAPEDVVVVPHKDPNKVRVKGYHIIDHLSPEMFQTVRADKPMTDNPAAQLMLAEAIAGDHVGKLEEVRITQQKGGGIVVTKLNQESKKPAQVELSKAVAIEDIEKALQAPKVDPKAIASAAAPEEDIPVNNPYRKLTLKDQAAVYTAVIMDMSATLNAKRAAASNLRAFQKAKKKSWDALGVTQQHLKVVTDLLTDQPAVKVSKKTKALSDRMKPKGEAPKAPQNDNANVARDREILRLLKLGKSKREIGRLMGISDRTVGRVADKFAA